MSKVLSVSYVNIIIWICHRHAVIVVRRPRIIRYFVTCVMIIFAPKVAISPNIPDHGKNISADNRNISPALSLGLGH